MERSFSGMKLSSSAFSRARISHWKSCGKGYDTGRFLELEFPHWDFTRSANMKIPHLGFMANMIWMVLLFCCHRPLGLINVYLHLFVLVFTKTFSKFVTHLLKFFQCNFLEKNQNFFEVKGASVNKFAVEEIFFLSQLKENSFFCTTFLLHFLWLPN